MADQTLTTGDDTVDFFIRLKGSINGATSIAMIDSTIDGGAGKDILNVDDWYPTSHFTLDASDTGIVTMTTVSGYTSFTNFEQIKFANVTMDLGSTGADSLVSTSTKGDLLFGFAGDDNLLGGIGADTLTGGSGNDSYVVDNVGDKVFELPSQGTDTVKSSITYGLSIDVENLTLTGSAAINATGNALANMLVGNSAANTISGGDGNDIMTGAAGNDKMNGGAGNEMITGGAGRDIMTGGTGKDMFIYKAISETGKLSTTRDTITDFTHASDKLHLSALDANSTLAGNQAFKFLGKGAFSGHAGELHFAVSGANTIVSGDTNGDKVADFHIQLNGNVALTAVDFVL
jgi:Ca2+-binding RTX toxin-like protein